MQPQIRRQHHMPFGAQLTAAAAVRFRLWAPAARQVDLMLYDTGGTQALAMRALPGGWFELETGAARAGSLYRFRLDGLREVADPASRRNPQGVHGPSEVIDPCAFAWDDEDWRAPPWPAAVIYELHVGTFSPEGTFAGAAARLEHLARLGVTAVELMPVAAFAGTRGWGYDGVLPYAPQGSYGTPQQLKALIAAAHRCGLAMLLDVVYNHFGPEGNYLHWYAPQFFNERHVTPWGPAINFDGPDSAPVRQFFIHNALYWLEEYHFDGLRLDAIHAVHDASEPHIVTEIARAARAAEGRSRTIYLTLENLDNAVRFLGAAGAAATCDAQWNDDAHHCLHVLLSGESGTYYADYARQPHALLCRSLAEGFAYQGEPSGYLGRPRGASSRHLPPSAFVNFLQNHDQIGNRARGERLTALVPDEAALRAAAAVLLLAPAPPLLFMGEEWAATEPFPWFCDFEPPLAARVFAHRRGEFPGSADPAAAATYASARLDWRRLEEPWHARALQYHRQLLSIRRREIAPLIARLRAGSCTAAEDGAAFAVEWAAGEQVLRLCANLSATAAPLVGSAAGRVIFATQDAGAALAGRQLAPWSVLWLLEHGRESR
ncbi:MAG TPA: malto-oligosyltrehalose trehalohydrolase [Steroidobacteraceae bacterium]|nr:malto-oligosyltrehalose trehalohydrolase [Steroidobacteraceae bacterium]